MQIKDERIPKKGDFSNFPWEERQVIYYFLSNNSFMAIYKMLLAGRCGMSEDELEKTIDKINKKTNIKIKGIYNKDLNDVRYVLEL